MKQDDKPRSMREAGVRERRRAMLHEPHIEPLTLYAARLREHGFDVPEFDPLDGGVNAQVLFLFEKPGPMTASKVVRVSSAATIMIPVRRLRSISCNVRELPAS